MSTEFVETMQASIKELRTTIAWKLALLGLAGLLVGAAVWLFAGDARAGAGVAMIFLAGVFTWGAIAFDWLQQWNAHRTDEHEDAKNEPAFASAEAIRNHGVVQNVNAKGHSRIVVNNAPSVNATQETVRLVPVHTPNKLVDDVLEADLADFIDRIFVVGHSQRALMGYRLPSGKIIDTFEVYDSHVAPLVKTRIIVDRGERRKGRLTVESPEQAKEILGLPAKSQIVAPD